MLLRAIGELNLDLEKSYYVGDRDIDTIAGRAAGLKTIEITQKALSLRETNKPDFVVSSLLEAEAIFEKEGIISKKE